MIIMIKQEIGSRPPHAVLDKACRSFGAYCLFQRPVSTRKPWQPAQQCVQVTLHAVLFFSRLAMKRLGLVSNGVGALLAKPTRRPDSMAQKGVISPELQRAIQQEQAKAQLQRTISELTSACWEKCIGTPGRSLSSREEACLSDCARRFLDTTKFIMQRAQSQQGGGGGF